MKLRSSFILALSLASIALVIYACGSSPTTPSSATATATPASSVPTNTKTPNPPTNTPTATSIPTNSGVVTTLAGSVGVTGATNASGTNATFSYPEGIAVDAYGYVYVGDYMNNMIRKISPGGAVTTFAGSGATGSTDATGTNASFDNPAGVALDSFGNLYVVDNSDNLIRKISPAGAVTTIAGQVGGGYADNAVGTNALFNGPMGIAVDTAGNVYVADMGNNMIRKISTGGAVTTLAGQLAYGHADNVVGTSASFYQPEGVAVDASGNVYVADSSNHMIRKISSAGAVTTLAGQTASGHADNAIGTNASFCSPYGVALDSYGNIYVADGCNNMIRKISPAGAVTTLAGQLTAGSADLTGTNASFKVPTNLAIDSYGTIYVADYGNDTIREIH
jgi:sugar lactone lactonase YvrE